MIQTLEDMIRRFCAYGLEFKDSDGFTHNWFTLIPALELAYKTSVNSSTGRTPAMLEKGSNPRIPGDTLRKDLIDINPTASSFKIILDKVKHDENRVCMTLLNMQNRSGTRVTRYQTSKPKELEDSYLGQFVIVALHGTNAVKVKLSGELENKHPTFPVSLIESYQPADQELFPLRNPTPLTVPPVEQSEDKRIKKVIEERRHRGKNQREYLVKYRYTVHEYEWLAESEIPDPDKLLGRFRHERRPQAWIHL
ncbi:hypothetical protein O181_051338 [Austropuccinia psidii MF-1]|uniref:Chromo domain-containing protein n=1 Tax=Austropuccinia psidii MF-1 TaxID=1389203 RepID=A0A9Q3E0S7_9BASI|nr:hypothetical protein [Austropuccinia psidii MF-1]